VRSWHHELVAQRIRDLGDAAMAAFSTADGMYHGRPESLRRLIGKAIDWLEQDEPDLADLVCDEAEIEIIGWRSSGWHPSPTGPRRCPVEAT
jgi:hypothetical protein